MTWQETIGFLTGCMPRPVGRALMQQPEGSVREIRVRAGGKVRILTAEGEISCACAPTQPQVEQMAEALCEHALYARAEEQRQGFVTLRGGHRMGLCGRVVAQGQSVRALRDISSLCLRVAGQWRGAAYVLMPHLWGRAGPRAQPADCRPSRHGQDHHAARCLPPPVRAGGAHVRGG